MDKYALIGHPISHSLSPSLFDAAYGGCGTYELVDNPDFEYCWKRFLEEFSGINVTAPFKEQALSRADIAHPECAVAGAANIVKKTELGLEAFNSDFLAVKSILDEVCPRGGRALVVGFGGAGRAAAAAAASCGMEVIVCNRDTSKDPGIRPLADIPQLAGNCEIMIYTLPCGIPQIEDLHCGIVLEANYRDPRLAGMHGIGRYIPGEEWLYRQALLGYSLLTGEKPDADALSARVLFLKARTSEKKF